MQCKGELKSVRWGGQFELRGEAVRVAKNSREGSREDPSPCSRSCCFFPVIVMFEVVDVSGV